MRDWDKVKLSDVSVAIQTGPFGSQLHQSDYSEIGVPVVMPKDIINGVILDFSIARVEKTHVQRLSRHVISEGDIIYPRRGDVEKCAYTKQNQAGWLCGTGCIRVTIDRKKASPKYIFYHLQESKTTGWVKNHAVGSTMLNLNTTILSNIPLSCPPLAIQHRIANILSRYDSLIANYQQQIKLLEEAAQRLYKEWFVDFRFPGHENTQIVDGVPEGWERNSVASLIGKTQRTKQVPTKEYLTKGSFPVIDQGRKFIAGYTNDRECLVNVSVPYIVFGDHTRVLKYIPFNFAKGADGTQLIMSNNLNRMPQCLFYYSLINVDISNYSYARHFKYLKEETIVVPDSDIAIKYRDIVSPMLDMVQRYRNQIILLTEARDRLLPKLMSGEVEV